MWQHIKLPEQIRPWDTLACRWDVKQPTNKQTAVQTPPPSSQNASSSGCTGLCYGRPMALPPFPSKPECFHQWLYWFVVWKTYGSAPLPLQTRMLPPVAVLVCGMEDLWLCPPSPPNQNASTSGCTGLCYGRPLALVPHPPPPPTPALSPSPAPQPLSGPVLSWVGENPPRCSVPSEMRLVECFLGLGPHSPLAG